MLASSLNELKPQKSDTESWYILSNYISYTILTLPQFHEMSATSTEIHEIIKFMKIASIQSCTLAQIVTTPR